jgi:hypothetical protein
VPGRCTTLLWGAEDNALSGSATSGDRFSTRSRDARGRPLDVLTGDYLWGWESGSDRMKIRDAGYTEDVPPSDEGFACLGTAIAKTSVSSSAPASQPGRAASGISRLAR